MMKVTQHLWFEKEMEAAIGFYTSLIPVRRSTGSRACPPTARADPWAASRSPPSRWATSATWPSRPGRSIRSTTASRFIVECETQAEIDGLWDALKEGGSTEQCGWLRDRWGLCWQITPRRLGELMGDPDAAKAKRVAEAMLKMVKFDIAGLEAAARG
jgi:predicted 3-demethylubiquinone-9 3-methyltransferase (glyoxalase superfamily)